MTDTRTRRLRILAELIRSGAFVSQEELTEKLKELGFAVTQATVSRDLEQLGAVKLKRGGVLSYALPDQFGAADWSAGRLERIVGEFVMSVEASGQIVVLKTPPGSAHLVASALDNAQLQEIAGTVSGDDTLFVAVREGTTTSLFVRRLRRMMGQEKVTYA